MKKYYVYFLLDPRRCYLPFYVGKGTGDRATHHLHTTWQKNTKNRFKQNIIDAIRRDGKEPIILIFGEYYSEDEAYRVEEEQIIRFGRRSDNSGILTNICASAKPPTKLGVPMLQQTKDKISAANKGKKRSDETRAKLSEQRKGRPRKPHSVETIEKIRQSNLGIKKRKLSEEEKLAISARTKAQWQDPARRLKAALAVELRRIAKEKLDD